MILPFLGIECSVFILTTRFEKAATLEVPVYQVKASADKAPGFGRIVEPRFSIRVKLDPLLP
jgi:hypothetical protein